MSDNVKLIVAGILIPALFSGCSLEETQEETPQKTQELNISSQKDSPSDLFKNLSQQCYMTDPSLAPAVVSVFYSTINPNDLPSDFDWPSLDEEKKAEFEKKGFVTEYSDETRYLYQTKQLTVQFEMCLHKARINGIPKIEKYFITRSRLSSLIARDFYAKSDYTNGNYWIQRVINLSGLSRGYLILGRLFIEDEKTLEVGSLFLKEGAKVGNETAKQMLFEAIINKTVFNKLRESNQNTNDSTD